jgi:uroporphyrinogen decarboxylase
VSESLLQQAIARRNPGRPPVWFMRQAGRYHHHYQRLRARHGFMELCKRPQLAAEVTLGPIEDFGFDAAILFSDLLFPLEAMGMGLRYEPGPKLDWHLRQPGDLARLQGGAARASHMSFQAEAIALLRSRLAPERSLIGFVGGPFTLYAYAVAGSHEGFARQGIA